MRQALETRRLPMRIIIIAPSTMMVPGTADEMEQPRRHEQRTRPQPPPEVEGGWFRQILSSAAAAKQKRVVGGPSMMIGGHEHRHEEGAAAGRWQDPLSPRGNDSTNPVGRAFPPRRRDYLMENNNKDHDDDNDKIMVREGYRRRLATYTPHNYFGKPPSLSPVVCARFGWKVKENDVLECEDCGATWRVDFPSTLVQGRAARRLTELYELEMASRHLDASRCRQFGTEARLYREEMVETYEGTTSWERCRLLPHAFIPIVSRATRKLWDDPVNCAERFRVEYEAVRQALTNALPNENHQWSWSIPDDIRRYRPEADDAFIGSGTSPNEWFEPSGSSSLLLRIIKAVGRNHIGSLLEAGSVEELSAALVLFGWSESLLEQLTDDARRSVSAPADAGATEAHTTQRNHWRLTCPFALSVLTLEARDVQNGSAAAEDAGVVKVPVSNNNVFMAHRYYSPYICGFPITIDSDGTNDAATALPIWKCLAARLLRVPVVESRPTTTNDAPTVVDNGGVTTESHNLEPFEAFEQAVTLLRSTVSPRLKRQRLSSSDVVPT